MELIVAPMPKPITDPRAVPCGAGPLTLAVLLALAAGCSTVPVPEPSTPTPRIKDGRSYYSLDDPTIPQEIVMVALGLLDTGYRFGGRNPEAGLDCSGMVSYVVEQSAGLRLPHNAAQIADSTRPIEVDQLEPGDLVFFNTLRRRHSHMGIYIGDGRFIHAPSSRGSVRIERLSNPYFASRIDGARTLLANR